MTQIISLLKDDKGQGMVEYGLIIALIAIAVIGVISLMGDNLVGIFDRINEALDFAKKDGGGNVDRDR